MRFKLSVPASGGRNSFDVGAQVGLHWDVTDAHLVSAAPDAAAPG
jgi:hypothetical protein